MPPYIAEPIRLAGSAAARLASLVRPPERQARVLARLTPYVWPVGRPDLKRIVLVSLGLMLIAKLVTVMMPFTFKWAVDALVERPAGPQAVPTAVWAAPVVLTALYGLVRITMVLLTQVREGLFATVAMHAVRRLALDTFEHMHRLSLRFHLERKTGGLTRVLERGRTGIEGITRMTLMTLLPTMVEFLLVLVVLLWVFDWRYVLLVVGMMIACFIVCRKRNYGVLKPFSMADTAKTTPGFMLAVFAVALVLWGLYTGAFSPTEAAAVTVVYCLFAGFFLTRELKVSALPDLIFRSGMIVGLIMPLVAVSLVMQQMFAVIGLSTYVGNLLAGLGNYYVILAVCMIVVFIAGMFLESVPITIIFAPIMAPVMVKAGADPFHFAVVFVVGTAIGFVTPPFGLNLFVASSISGVPYLQISRYVVPYLYALLLTWTLIALVPILSTYLVQFAGLAGGGSLMK